MYWRWTFVVWSYWFCFVSCCSCEFLFFVGRFFWTLTWMSISIQMVIYCAGFDIEITWLSIDRLVMWPCVLHKWHKVLENTSPDFIIWVRINMENLQTLVKLTRIQFTSCGFSNVQSGGPPWYQCSLQRSGCFSPTENLFGLLGCFVGPSLWED